MTPRDCDSAVTLRSVFTDFFLERLLLTFCSAFFHGDGFDIQYFVYSCIQPSNYLRH